MLSLPKHGGDLKWASERFAVAPEDWLDLSTGISPWSWPVEHWPQHVFRALPPQSLQQLQELAAQYYGCAEHALLPVPGSQYAISSIPAMVEASTVAIPALGYQEHAQAWQRAGHQLHYYRDFDELRAWVNSGRVSNVVLINPNNPTGVRVSRTALEQLQQSLMQGTDGHGLLLVDEAFMDVDPTHSLAAASLPNTLVLRSFGKFFGLAGVRLGFVVDASGYWRAQLRDQTGPWLISHPAVWVAGQALRDNAWVVLQRRRISASSAQLLELLQAHLRERGLSCQCQSAGLFVTVTGSPAPLYNLFVHLAQQAILTRYGQAGEHRGWLRFGLSPCYRRLSSALVGAGN